MNLCEHLCVTARLLPNQAALVFEGQQLTYGQLDRFSAAASQRLIELGVQPGDRVAIVLPNVPAFPVWYYAILRIGAIAVSISTRSAASEVDFVVTDCQASAVILAESSPLNEKVALPTTPTLSVDDLGTPSGATGWGRDTPPPSWFQADPNDAAVILYTSGTTGYPKGATLSHGNVRSNVHAFNHLCQMKSSDRVLLAVPLFHCFGQNALLNSVLNVGGTLVLQRRFDLNETKRLIGSKKITQLYGVPMMFQLLLEHGSKEDLQSVTYCFSAAATLPIQISQQWREKFGMPINEGYGLTETSPFASYNHRIRFVEGSIGMPVDNVEMKIVDTETGQDCAPGQLGEIAIRGPGVMKGYWNRPEETAAAVREGWFYSGDIGRIDDQGYFYIVDRVKDMIAVGGLKVYPAEVERVLRDQPDVEDAAVVGMPDPVFGQKVVAFVVTESPASTEMLSEIDRFAHGQLANYKVPRVIIPLDELPRNPSGKVLKTKLRQHDLSATNPSPTETTSAVPSQAAPLTSRLRPATLRAQLQSAYPVDYPRLAGEFIQHLVRELADLDELPELDSRFLDNEMDSLMIVELSHQIQVELGDQHPIPATLIFDRPRLCDLRDFLMEHLTDSPTNVTDNAIVPVDDSITSPPSDAVERDIQSLSEQEALELLMKELDG